MLSKKDSLLVALSCLPRVGRKTIDKIYESSGLVSQIDDDILCKYLSIANHNEISSFISQKGSLFRRVEKINELMNVHFIHICNFEDDEYPFLLKQTIDRPLYLFYRGNINAISLPQLAIVGSRRASPSGLRHAYQFSNQLSTLGYCITSGLALGIDSSAHKGALDAGKPTIAVMGTGLDAIYPKSNQYLADSILENGCWLSEYLVGSKPVAANFPRRNRIISGLALGVIVVEAKPKSGTLITARMAIEQNREVFAVPGPIDYIGSHGCHNLINDGAKLLQCVEDILEELPLGLSNELSVSNFQCSNAHSDELVKQHNIKKGSQLDVVLNNVSFDVRTLSQIASSADIPINTVIPIITELELLGLVASHSGGFIRTL